jgi:hypothetical protein
MLFLWAGVAHLHQEAWSTNGTPVAADFQGNLEKRFLRDAPFSDAPQDEGGTYELPFCKKKRARRPAFDIDVRSRALSILR